MSLALEELPELVLEKIMLNLQYDEIARLRIVSTKFNTLCKGLLNKGFRAVEKYHAKCLKEMKSKLPRRESERRDHPMARHCDILTAIETRISLLGMTFMKFVDLDVCCFIPGKVIDEIFNVLRIIKTEKTLPRAFEILQELRDISSMAMEYFDEKILPTLRVRLSNSSLNLSSSIMSGVLSPGSLSYSVRYDISPPSTSSPISRIPLLTSPPKSNTPTRRKSLILDIDTISRSNKRLSQRNSRLVRDLKKQADSYKSSIDTQNKKIVELDQRIDQQNEIINQQNARLAEQEEKLAEMNRRMSENTTQLTELSRDNANIKARAAATNGNAVLSPDPMCGRTTGLAGGGRTGGDSNKDLMIVPVSGQKPGTKRKRSLDDESSSPTLKRDRK